MNAKRLYGYDNLRALLIFLVVFAHLLEICGQFPHKKEIYFTIYSFHMPAFVFLSGLFCGKRPKLGRFFLMYLLFQTLYLIAVWRINGKVGALRLQYTTPYWILWYLLALIAYWAVSPYLLSSSLRKQAALLAASLCLALLAGLDDSVGRVLSLSRILVFFPFFLLGCMLNPRREALQDRLRGLGAIRWALFAAGLALLPLLMLRWGKTATPWMLYGSFSYAERAYGPGIRLLQYAAAGLWIGWLLVLQSLADFRIPGVSCLGRNTLWVFLLHGFVLRLAGKRKCFAPFSRTEALLLVPAAAILLLVLFGNPLVDAGMRRLLFLGAGNRKRNTERLGRDLAV